MRLAVATAVREEERGYVRGRRVISGGCPKLQEVEDAKNSQEEERAPQAKIVVGEERGEQKARRAADTKQEGANGDAGERAFTVWPKVVWQRWLPELNIRRFSCSEAGIEFGRPFSLLYRAVYGERDVRMRGGGFAVLRHVASKK